MTGLPPVGLPLSLFLHAASTWYHELSLDSLLVLCM